MVRLTPTVNIAARFADYARPGEVLVSEAVRDASDDTNIAFADMGPVELKGVSGVMRLYAARGMSWSSDAPDGVPTP